MTKLLNLDDLPTTLEVSIVHNNTTHYMQPLSVEAFIANQRAMDRLERGELQTETEKFEALVEMIAGAFPTFPRDEIARLPVNKLFAVVGHITEQQATAEKDAAAEKNG